MSGLQNVTVVVGGQAVPALQRSTVVVGGGLLTPTTLQTITLKNTLRPDPNRLDGMVDVVADSGNTVTGSTLVYDASTDKYIVKLLDIDGGFF